jgi:hypothetical protein
MNNVVVMWRYATVINIQINSIAVGDKQNVGWIHVSYYVEIISIYYR